MVAHARLHLLPPLETPPAGEKRFDFHALAGRFVELSGDAGAPLLSVALSLVAAAQRAGENVAWVSGTRSTFYATDTQGIDLAALPIIRAPDSQRAGRAVSHLLRSGSFGLVVLDLLPFPTSTRELALPLQSRLSGLAQKHGALFLALTEKPATAPSLGSLVSLHGRVTRRSAPTRPDPDGHLRVTVEVLATKDKRNGPGWSHIDQFKAPDGLT